MCFSSCEKSGFWHCSFTDIFLTVNHGIVSISPFVPKPNGINTTFGGQLLYACLGRSRQYFFFFGREKWKLGVITLSVEGTAK